MIGIWRVAHRSKAKDPPPLTSDSYLATWSSKDPALAFGKLTRPSEEHSSREERGIGRQTSISGRGPGRLREGRLELAFMKEALSRRNVSMSSSGEDCGGTAEGRASSIGESKAEALFQPFIDTANGELKFVGSIPMTK